MRPRQLFETSRFDDCDASKMACPSDGLAAKHGKPSAAAIDRDPSLASVFSADRLDLQS